MAPATIDDGTSEDFVGLGADVAWPDTAPGAGAVDAAASRPVGGRLGELAAWWASVSDHPSTAPLRARLVVLGDGPAAAGVAELAGAGVRPAAATDRGIAAGVGLLDAEVDGGADLVIVAVPDSDEAALTLVSVLTNTEPVKVLPRGTSVDPAVWMAQAVAVRDRRRVIFDHRHQPAALAAALSSPTMECAAAVVLRAAGRRTPMVLDGLGAVAAGLLAHAISPRASRWWQVADRGDHPAIDIATAKLGQRPILDAGIGQADGTAGALALLMLRAATVPTPLG